MDHIWHICTILPYQKFFPIKNGIPNRMTPGGKPAAGAWEIRFDESYETIKQKEQVQIINIYQEFFPGI